MAAGVVTITYSLTGAAGCYSTRTLTVTPLAALRPGAANTEGSTIEIFPNPNKGTFTVSGIFSSITEEEEAWLQVTDMHGRVVYTAHTTIYNSRIEEVVQLNNVANGMYFVNINTAAQHTRLRVVVDQ
jgi:hypothetical protein